MDVQNHPHKTPRESTFENRKIVTPDLLNSNGTLFGGVTMSWIDEVAFMSARRYSGLPFVVTANIDHVNFFHPLKLGDHALLSSIVQYAGRTSMDIFVSVDREDQFDGSRLRVTSANLTFIALSSEGRPCPVPRLLLETEDDRARHRKSLIRIRVRSRMANYLQKTGASRTRGSGDVAALDC